MAHTPVAVISCLGAALALAPGCGGGGDSTDAGPPDAADVIDARPPADAPVDALVIDAPTPPAGATCDTAIELAPGANASGDTSGMIDVATGLCSLGSDSAEETKYVVDLGETPRDLVVQVDVDEEAETPFDAVVYARATCNDSGTQLVCADAGWSERADVLAATGLVYLFVDGTYQHGGAKEGAFMISTSVREVVGENDACDPAGVTSRCATGFRCTSSVCVADSPAAHCDEAAVLDVSGGSATATRTTFAYAANHYDGSCVFDADAALPEHIFAVTVGAGADLVASTDNATTDFDTYVYLRAGTCDGTEVGCDDDVDTENQNLTSTLSVTDLAAGTYYIFVDGSSRSPGTGTFRLDVTITP